MADLGSELGLQLFLVDVGVLEHVVQNGCGHHVVGIVRAFEEGGHLQRMDQKRGSVRVAPLVAVALAGEGDRLSSQG